MAEGNAAIRIKQIQEDWKAMRYLASMKNEAPRMVRLTSRLRPTHLCVTLALADEPYMAGRMHAAVFLLVASSPTEPSGQWQRCPPFAARVLTGPLGRSVFRHLFYRPHPQAPAWRGRLCRLGRLPIAR